MDYNWVMSAVRRLKQAFLAPHVVWSRQIADHEVSIQLRQPLFLVVLLGLAVWYVAAPMPVVAISLALCLGLGAVSLWWAMEMTRNLSARRQLETAVMQVGDELEEQIFVSNRSLLPLLWVEVADQSTLPGYTISSVRAASPRSEMNWRVRSVCRRRGIHNLGPWELRTSDPFGLLGVVHGYLKPQQILVYPQLAALPTEILPHRGAQGEQRPLNLPVSAETADAMMVRGYTSGDPLHHIHWGTTARRGTPYVKVFEPEASSRIWIVVDLDAMVQVGDGAQSTIETTILLAASLAARLLQDKIAVGVFAGGTPPSLVLPGRGQAHLWTILERLAPLDSERRPTLAVALEQLLPLVSLRDLLVVITPSLDAGWPMVLLRMARARGGGMAELILLDRESFGEVSEAGDAQRFGDAQTAHGFQVRVLRKGDVQPMQAAYGALSRWEFTVSATGKAIARQAPRGAVVAAGRSSPEGRG